MGITQFLAGLRPQRATMTPLELVSKRMTGLKLDKLQLQTFMDIFKKYVNLQKATRNPAYAKEYVNPTLKKIKAAIKGQQLVMGDKEFKNPTQFLTAMLGEPAKAPGIAGMDIRKALGLSTFGLAYIGAAGLMAERNASARYKRMLLENPELKGEEGRYPESKVRRTFKSLTRINPEIVSDPTMAATAVKQFIDTQGIPAETFISLSKAKSGNKTQDKLFNAIVGGI